MPSIAGAVVVSWLVSRAHAQVRELLYLPKAGAILDTPSLILLFLYGNLFCYVASYPILCFHVTRVVDFKAGRWRANPLVDGYLVTIEVATAALLCAIFAPPLWHFPIVFALILSFVVAQLHRIYSVLSPRIKVDGLAETVCPAFGFSYALARRRGIPEESEETTKPQHVVGVDRGLEAEVEEDDEFGVLTTRRRISWRPEFMASYRHLREHGNSAFIFIQELTLAALLSCIISRPTTSGVEQLGLVGIILGSWAAPGIFVHLIGQHLERRFSRFELRLR
jgi:hypothetical protein